MMQTNAWRRSLITTVIFTLSASSDGKDISSIAPRRLEDEYGYDLSSYSVRFEKCQHIKTFDDEIAANEDSNTVFAVKHFVVYKLCPSDQCEECDSNYGEYVAELEDYLMATGQAAKRALEYYCQNCEQNCNENGNCDEECQEKCGNYGNNGGNGYLDATDLLECQKIDMQGGNGDNMQLYTGPRCSSDGSSILIGLFTDENCYEPYDLENGLTVESIIGYDISYDLLESTYSDNPEDCMSCAESIDGEDERDQEDQDDVNEMCEEIYSASAKCESIHGISNGFIRENRKEGEYENQVENEFAVCTFIASIKWNSYTETGEINVFDEQDEVIRNTTTLQKLVLSFLVITAASLAGLAAFLHRSINEGFPDLNFSCQNGQMT